MFGWFKPTCLLAIFLFACGGCLGGSVFDGPGANAAEASQLSNALFWQRIWQDFQNQYSYFDLKRVDWNAVLAQNKNSFDGLTPDVFAEKLNDILQVLHDWHVAVRKPDGSLVGYRGRYTDNAPPRLYTAYASGASYQSLSNTNTVVIHGLLANNIAHIIITTLETSAFAAITDQQIQDLFFTYRDAAGIIFDLRYNSGGNENNALKFAGRLTDTPQTYGYYRFRLTNSIPYQFGPLTPKVLTPLAGIRFRGPVVGLIGQRCLSSAEWFALMMRACPNSILIGDMTRGSSGNPVWVDLPVLNLSYTISRWIGYDDQQTPIEDRGIAPEIQISAGTSFDDSLKRDYVLDRAIHYIRWRQTFDTGSIPLGPSEDYDQDGLSNLQEYWAGTNPNNPASQLAVRIRRDQLAGQPSVELSWPSVEGKRYRVWASNNSGAGFLPGSTELAATPPLNTFMPQVKPGMNSEFYRIELLRD